ncbi:MAG: hypothetical protein PUP92_30170 [Rhizonema sp. PD38]|nr:hypothetical protein [Rhizonema sp. PD38]
MKIADARSDAPDARSHDCVSSWEKTRYRFANASLTKIANADARSSLPLVRVASPLGRRQGRSLTGDAPPSLTLR